MKKVLIITYYWPPGGGSGVQRWLKFAKYLREFGWEPVIYTVEDGEMPVIDHSLEKDIPEGIEILKQPIWEPYDVYKKFVGRKKEETIKTAFIDDGGKPKATEKVARWVRGNFFIPDARKFWIKPSVRYLLNYLQEHPVELMVSTGPPHSMHLIALGIKKRMNLPWVADFRDPWTNIDFYEELLLTKWADRKHKRLERKVLETADKVVSVGSTLNEELAALGAKDPLVITNGFDESDVQLTDVKLDEQFSIAHIGALSQSRNHEVLWKVLGELCQHEPGFSDYLKISLVGNVDHSAIRSIEKEGLSTFVERIEYLEHGAVIRKQQESQVLLLMLNNSPNAKGILTGKMFEYMSANRPILAIGHEEGDAAKVIRSTGCGLISGFHDADALKVHILQYYSAFKKKELVGNGSGIATFSRRNLTEQLAQAFNQLTNEH